MKQEVQGVRVRSTEPLKLAEQFIQDQFPTPGGGKGLWVYQDGVLEWPKGRGSKRDKGWVEWVVSQWLKDATKVSRTKEGDEVHMRVAPDMKMVRDVAQGVMLMAQGGWKDVPRWLANEATPSRWSVGFQDKVVSVEGEVERNEQWVDTVTLPCNWEEGAECPTWERCLEQWSEGDHNWVELLERWMGYCLVADRGLGRWMLMKGKIRGGKGTIARLMKALRGEEHLFWATTRQVGGSFGLNGLQHARMMVIPEVKEMNRAEGEDLAQIIKMIVGGDGLTIDIKYSQPLKGVVPPATVTVMANEIPLLPDKGEGVSGKMLVLPFTQSFKGREIFDLDERLKAEIPGIARRLVGAMRRLAKEGDPKKKWPIPQQAGEMFHEYVITNNVYRGFLEARFMETEDGFVPGWLIKELWYEYLRANKTPRNRVCPENHLLKTLEQECGWTIWRARRAGGTERGMKGLAVRAEFRDEVFPEGCDR